VRIVSQWFAGNLAVSSRYRSFAGEPSCIFTKPSSVVLGLLALRRPCPPRPSPYKRPDSDRGAGYFPTQRLADNATAVTFHRQFPGDAAPGTVRISCCCASVRSDAAKRAYAWFFAIDDRQTTEAKTTYHTDFRLPFSRLGGTFRRAPGFRLVPA